MLPHKVAQSRSPNADIHPNFHHLATCRVRVDNGLAVAMPPDKVSSVRPVPVRALPAPDGVPTNGVPTVMIPIERWDVMHIQLDNESAGVKGTPTHLFHVFPSANAGVLTLPPGLKKTIIRYALNRPDRSNRVEHVSWAKAIAVLKTPVVDDVQTSTHHREDHPVPSGPAGISQMLHPRRTIDGEVAITTTVPFQHP